MPSKKRRGPSYSPCRNNNYTVQENFFTVTESRLKECLGNMYDHAMKANPVLSHTLRDAFTGALISILAVAIPDFISFGTSDLSRFMKSYWGIFPLLVGACVFWVLDSNRTAQKRNDLDKRARLIDEEFKSIVSLSQSSSAVAEDQGNKE